MTTNEDVPTYKKKDFISDQTVRWCPGCGDYAILSQVQTVFAILPGPTLHHQFVIPASCWRCLDKVSPAC